MRLAEPILDKLLPLARTSGSQSLRAYALLHLGQLKSVHSEFDRGIRLLDDAFRLFDRLGNHEQTAVVGTSVAQLQATLGDFDQAEALLSRFAKERKRSDSAAFATLVPMSHTILAHTRGTWQQAVSAGRETIEKARAGGHRVHEYVASVFLGLPLARLGDLGKGIRVQEQSIALSSQVRLRVLLDRAHAWLAEMRLEAGDATGAGEAAKQHLGAALDAFTAQGALPETARCHAALASVAETGSERLQHRLQAEKMFQAMGMRWDLERLLEAEARPALGGAR